MDTTELKAILERLERGDITLPAAMEALRRFPIESLGHTQIDTHRAFRCGAEEVVFAEGKSLAHLKDIIAAHLDRSGRVLATRVLADHVAALGERFPQLQFSDSARTAWAGRSTLGDEPWDGVLGVVSAGTSDAPVVEEAACTASYFGCNVLRINDVGVAGLHRLLGALPQLRECDGLVVVAGMDGALASVVSGLLPMPIIAVPTSVGYGAAFGGLAPLLSMLVSCAPGVSVVNIDNGFGAIMALLRMIRRPKSC